MPPIEQSGPQAEAGSRCDQALCKALKRKPIVSRRHLSAWEVARP